MTEHVDVLVVGGGLVGATLIHALGAARQRTAWIERNALDAMVCDPRSTALACTSQRLLSDLGLWAAVGSRAEAIREVKISQAGHLGSVTLSAADMAVPALGYVAPNRLLASALADAISARDDLLSITSDAVVALREADDGVTVTLESGRTLVARLVVAADGAQSVVRESAGIALRRDVTFDQHAVVAEITGTGWPAGVAWERFCRSGPLALLPLAPDRLSLVYTVSDQDLERVLALDDTAFMAEIGRLSGLGAAFHEVTGRQAFPLVARSADTGWRGRVVLIGNAARTLHPVAGQGFNLALRDCLSLAELLCELAPGADPGQELLAARYRQWRGADQRRTEAATEGLARLFRGESTMLGHARGLGLLLADRLAPVRRGLARQFMGLGGRLPRVVPRD